MAIKKNPPLHRWFSLLFICLGTVCIGLLSMNLYAKDPTPTELGLALIEKGELKRGATALKLLAKNNDPAAMVALFEFYRSGFYVPVNQQLAKEYLKRAVESGDQIARWRWATTKRYNNGRVNTQMLEELYEDGFDVAVCGLTLTGSSYSEEERNRVCKDATYRLAASGNDRAIYNLWLTDDPRSDDLLAELAPPRLKAFVASYDWDTNPTQGNLETLVSSLKLGGLYAAVLIVHRVEDTPGHIVNEQDRLLQRLPQSDLQLISNSLVSFVAGERKGWFIDHVASVYLGAFFREGRDYLNIKPDWKAAYELYNSCGRAYSAGFCDIWSGYLLNSGGPNLSPNPEKAVEHFMLGHEAGNSDGTILLGTAYQLGVGVELNFARAAEFYNEAISRGNLRGYSNLANLYVDGLGVEPDEVLAAEFYAKAATHAFDGRGDPISMIRLAELHERNRLPNSDLNIALDWFERASVKNTLYEKLAIADSDSVSYQAIARVGVRRVSDKLKQLAAKVKGVDFGSYKALLVANNNYAELTDLRSPSGDVALIGAILEKRFGAQVEYLIDSDRNDLLSKLSQYRRDLGPEDNFILYYAGHGIYDEELEVGYWQLSDAKADEDYSWVETDRVSRTLSAFKSRNAMIIADSCYSGSVVRGTSAVGDVSNLAAIKSLNAKKSRVAITSGGLQPVLDATGSSENSSFAKNFAAALESVRVPTPASVLFNDLRTAVSAETATWGFEQVPEFAPLYRAGHDGGDFILSPVSK